MGNVKKTWQTSWDFPVNFVKKSNVLEWGIFKILFCASINLIQITDANGVAPEIPQDNTGF